jgi:hypothetical protein
MLRPGRRWWGRRGNLRSADAYSEDRPDAAVLASLAEIFARMECPPAQLFTIARLASDSAGMVEVRPSSDGSVVFMRHATHDILLVDRDGEIGPLEQWR